MAKTYHYSATGDFPAGKVATDALEAEIAAAGITSAAYLWVSLLEDDCAITFDAALSSGDEVLLDGVVAAHLGDPLPFVDVIEGVVQSDGALLTGSAAAKDPGEIRFDGSRFSLYDATGEFNPRLGGVTEEQHKLLDQLVHSLAETCFYEVVYSGNRVVSETWWATAGVMKIREITYSYSGGKIETETQRQYDVTGALASTLVITYSYSGARISTADHVYSEP